MGSAATDPLLYESLRKLEWTQAMKYASQNIGLRFTHLDWSPLHVAYVFLIWRSDIDMTD